MIIENQNILSFKISFTLKFCKAYAKKLKQEREFLENEIKHQEECGEQQKQKKFLKAKENLSLFMKSITMYYIQESALLNMEKNH